MSVSKSWIVWLACSLITFSTHAIDQVFSPTLDGYVRQQQGDFVINLSYAELKKHSSFSREVYLNFDFSNISIDAKTAKLRIFCQSFDKYSEPTISVYCFSGYQTDGLTWASRPVYPVATASVSINQIEFSNAWLEWNISPFLDIVLSAESKQATFVIVTTEGNDALLKLTMSESTINQPSILLTEEEPIIDPGQESKIKMPTLFSDNMVIQRDKPIRIWGEVLSNEPVAILFDGITYYAQCDALGKFNATIPAKSASGDVYSMIIYAAGDSVAYNNLVMGDVYLCAGQSNMAFKLNSVQSDQRLNATNDGNYPNLRYFDVAKIVNGGVLTGDVDKPWRSAIPERITDWSAVAFFFGRDLHKHIDVPIGLINCSHGGAPSDAFISPEAYASDPILNAAKRPDGSGIYQYYQTPSSLYNSMVSKLVGYPLKGVVWYQAEGNAVYWNNFKTIFKGLINDWRTKWSEPELPWLFVQLPAYEPTTDPTSMTWAEIRDIQLQCWLDDQNTGMVVTMDCGEANNIHPADKYTVAKRLVPYARALIYKEDVAHKSPVYKSLQVAGQYVYVTFDNIGAGLKVTKSITEFEVAGADKVYKYATAELLQDNTLRLFEPTIAAPVFVRYAFRNFSTVSIFTTDDLPMPLSPFKTDDGTSAVVDNTSIPFESIKAVYASSTYPGRIPEYAVNGSGLNGETHEASITAKAWHTNNDPFPHYFKIEMIEPQSIGSIKIWNLNWSAAYLNRGIREIEIYVSPEFASLSEVGFNNGLWKKVISHSMSQASGLSNYSGELITFPSSEENVKWVGIHILNSHNTANNYTGISEIKLYNTITTHTASISHIPELTKIQVRDNNMYIKNQNERRLLYQLYALSGTPLLSGIINYSDEVISLEGISKGVYVISFKDGEYSQQLKVII